MRKIKLVINRLVRPRSIDEEAKRQEYVLNVILLGSILLLFIASLVSVFYIIIFQMSHPGERFPGNSPLIMLVLLVIFVILFTLSRRGYFKLASLLIVAFYFLPTAQSLFRWGINLPSSLLALALIIVLAGILLGVKYAFLITSLVTLLFLACYYLQVYGIYRPDLSWRFEPIRFGNVVVFLLMFFLILSVSWLYNRQVETSLLRAKKSEAALKKERDLLEIKIANRTAELIKAQQEKIAQLFQFAKFGQIAGGILHDLINPLTAISLNLEKLNETEFSELGNTKQHLQLAMQAAKKAEEFISVARKQMQQREERVLFSVNQEIGQAIDILSYKAKSAAVEIKFIAPVEVKLSGNAIKFHQAITNIISNAIDSYDNKKSSSAKIVKIEIKKDLNQCYLAVKDEGKGISPENIEQIFDPLFTTKANGTGIGLCVAKEIVEGAFGGEIKVESQIGKGTIFTVNFPLKSDLKMEKADVR